ncbi:MAG: hypothetical protein ABSH09_36630 [Bryobacteraceae bacterium]|jgi:hypothetical protein
MSDSVRFTVAALIFVSVAGGIAAVYYRLLYARKTGQGSSPPPLPYAPPPIVHGSPIPPYTPPGGMQPASAPAPAVPAKGRAWSANAWAIHDEQSARQVARQAMWAAFFVAIVTGAAAFLAGSGIQMINGVGPTAWVDAVVFAALGIGIARMSRLAAAGALLLYIAERIWMAPAVGLSPVMTIAMISAFVQGVRGAWAFHKYRQQSPYPPVVAQRYS